MLLLRLKNLFDFMQRPKMPHFTNHYPASVCGKKYRTPLRSPAVERLAGMMEELYREESLHPKVRGVLLREYKLLVKIDSCFVKVASGCGSGGCFAYLLEDTYLPYTHERPAAPMFGGMIGTFLTSQAGYCFRLYEYFQKVASTYNIAVCDPPYNDDI